MSTDNESARTSELSRIQSWMQAAITRPCGDPHDLAASGETAAAIVAPSSTLSGAERLAIYSRSYRARLVQCFETMFPGLLHALGQDLFTRFALDYLQRYHPRSYTLNQLADDFPRHLAETRPDAGRPPGEREAWPDFIINLATLELAFLKVYDGAGVEDRALPAARDILALDNRHLLDARPAPVPCLRLLAFSYPVGDYLFAARRGEQPQPPAPAQNFVALTRRNYRVTLHRISSDEYAALNALDGAQTVAQALLEVAPSHDSSVAPVAAVRRWLCDWADKGFVLSL